MLKVSAEDVDTEKMPKNKRDLNKVNDFEISLKGSKMFIFGHFDQCKNLSKKKKTNVQAIWSLLKFNC